MEKNKELSRALNFWDVLVVTFFHNSGLRAFEPEEWDYKIGEWLDLSGVK